MEDTVSTMNSRSEDPARINRRSFLKLAGASLAALAVGGCSDSKPLEFSADPAGQKPITQVEKMPNLPQPFAMRDWKSVSQKYDQLVFDFNAKGDFLPLIWPDTTRVNMPRDGFGLPSYVGDTRQGTGSAHEGITCISAVLGASLVGIDKSNQDGRDYVDMLEDYYNSANGQNLVLNSVSAKTGYTFWYEIYPSLLYSALSALYPQKSRMAEINRSVAERWYAACQVMGGSDTSFPNFLYTAFNFEEMQPKFNGQWYEPDGAAGVGWLEYMAYVQFKDEKFLQAADWCLQFLMNIERDPLYEVLLPFGAALAVRMNAELGRQYDTQKLINWCFDGSYYRFDWGVNSRRWSDYDTHGLASLRTVASGYAFAMNTFAWAGALTPVARYDVSYGRAIGKWMLNLANSARLFYANALPPDHQSSSFWKGDPDSVIAYEGLQEISDRGVKVYAAGDPIKMRWGKTDFGLYGSSHVGMLGAIAAPTKDEKILQLDLLATDFHHAEAYPTFLYYNPYDVSKDVELSLGDQAVDLYDAINHRFMRKNARGTLALALPADTACVLVQVPRGGKISYQDKKMLINHVVVDFNHPQTS